MLANREITVAEETFLFSCLCNTVLIFNGCGRLLYRLDITPRDPCLAAAIGDESLTTAYLSTVQSWCYNQRFGEPVESLFMRSYEVHFFCRDVEIRPEQPVRNDDLENRLYVAIIGERVDLRWSVPPALLRPIFADVWDDYLRYHWQITSSAKEQVFPELDNDLTALFLSVNAIINACRDKLPNGA